MNKKENFLCDIKNESNIKISLMVMKILVKDSSKVVCILVDKSGEIKANIPSKNGDIKIAKTKKSIRTDIARFLPTSKKNPATPKTTADDENEMPKLWSEPEYIFNISLRVSLIIRPGSANNSFNLRKLSTYPRLTELKYKNTLLMIR